MVAATTNGNGNTALATNDREMTYIPFASKDAIKLSVGIVKNLVSAKTKNGAVCTDADAMKFMMLCKARGLNPFEGDAFLIGYDGKDGPVFSLITSHQAFLKRAEVHPEYDGMESGVIVRTADGEMVDREGDFIFDDDTILGGWATVHFKNRKFPMKKRLKLGVFHKGRGLWNDNPCGMICKCAEADALRSAFPTMLGGMYAQEEMPPPPEIVDVKPAAPPVGRARIKPSPPPAPKVADTIPQEDYHGDDEPEPIDEAAAADLNDLAEEFKTRISEAGSLTMTQKIGGELKEREQAFGPTLYGQLMEFLQSRNRGLTKK